MIAGTVSTQSHVTAFTSTRKRRHFHRQLPSHLGTDAGCKVRGVMRRAPVCAWTGNQVTRSHPSLCHHTVYTLCKIVVLYGQNILGPFFEYGKFRKKHGWRWICCLKLWVAQSQHGRLRVSTAGSELAWPAQCQHGRLSASWNARRLLANARDSACQASSVMPHQFSHHHVMTKPASIKRLQKHIKDHSLKQNRENALEYQVVLHSKQTIRACYGSKT